MAQHYINLNDRYKILTPTGWSNFHGILKQEKIGLITITTESNKTLECTLDHKIKTKKGFIQADSLKIFDKILTEHGHEKIINIIKNENGKKYVYDALEVEKENTYYSNSIASHNCGFLGSSGTLIEGSKLKSLVFKQPIIDKAGLTVYDEPKEGHTYICIVDVSRGKGLDYSAFQLIDVTKMPYKQVATFRDNTIGPADYAGIIHQITKKYYEPYVLVEINDIGEQVAEILAFDYEVEGILFTENAGRGGKRISGGYGKNVDKGIRTTKSVKAIGCNMLKMLIEQDQLIIRDFNTINELSTFSRRGNSYEAESGCHDDLVMGLVLFSWLTDQAFFKDITNINTMMTLKRKNEEDLFADVMPDMIIDDGLGDDMKKEEDNPWMVDYSLRDF